MRWLARAMAIALSGCSFGMHGVDPTWDHQSEPQCSDNTVWIDRVVGTSLIVAGSSTYAQFRNDAAAPVALPFVALGILYEIAGVYGAHRYAECQMARTRWWYSNAIKPVSPPPVSPPPVSPPPVVPPKDRPWAAGVSEDEQALALKLYNDGNQSFVQHLYAEALAKYKQAVVHWDHPAIRFNMVVCLLELAQPVEARDSLEHSLAFGAAALGPEAYARALGYREQLDRSLVRLTLDCPEPGEEVMLDGQRIFHGPGQVIRFLAPGEHEVVANKPGYLPASKRILLIAGQPASYEIRPLIDPRPTP